MSILARYGTVLRIYDNGGRTFDRYTIIPPRWATESRERGLLWEAIAASENPFHPQGFGMHVTACPGPHLGKRIPWNDLPDEVQKLAWETFPEHCPGEPTEYTFTNLVGYKIVYDRATKSWSWKRQRSYGHLHQTGFRNKGEAMASALIHSREVAA